MIGSQISSYTLVSKIGSGPRGSIYRGVYVSDPAVSVAVKLWNPVTDHDPAQLRAACAAVSGLEHSNIAALHELCMAGPQVATVQELLDGQDLAAVLASGPLPIREVTRILQSSLEALQYAHREDVLHENTKPTNLFRCRSGEIKLLDFSLTAVEDAPEAAQLDRLNYTPPERFHAGASPATDVYAIGLVAWELLSGRRACPDGTPSQKQAWHQAEGLSDIRSMRLDCPEWMAELVATLSHPKLDQRPEDGGAALALLRSLMRYQPVILANLQANTPAPYEHPPAPSFQDLSPSLEAAAPEPDEAAPPAAMRPNWLTRLLGATAAIAGLPAGGALAIDTHQRSAAFTEAAEVNTAEGWEAFIRAWPEHPQLDAAQATLQDARLARLQSVYPMQQVVPGTYAIGCTPGQGDACENAETLHDVTLTQAYLIGEAEVTQGLYASVMGNNPSQSSSCGADCPVEQVSWFDAVTFANALNLREDLPPCYAIDGESVSMPSGLHCGGFRLPTEAEWEVAARGGQDLKFSGSDRIDEVRVGNGTAVHPVRQKAPNGYGLHDMSGNVKEWVWDLYSESDTVNPSSGSGMRVSRGGSWIFGETLVSSRDGDSPEERFSNLGFRLIIQLDAE